MTVVAYRRNVFPVRERPSVDRLPHEGDGPDRSGPRACERCGRPFWSYDLTRQFACDRCFVRPRRMPGEPDPGRADEEWLAALRADDEALRAADEGHYWQSRYGIGE